ncbi:hypothetical protein L209DRAFT_552887 [Thermothelomyces heterothallicus CBS 203.75]
MSTSHNEVCAPLSPLPLPPTLAPLAPLPAPQPLAATRPTVGPQRLLSHGHPAGKLGRAVDLFWRFPPLGMSVGHGFCCLNVPIRSRTPWICCYLFLGGKKGTQPNSEGRDKQLASIVHTYNIALPPDTVHHDTASRPGP